MTRDPATGWIDARILSAIPEVLDLRPRPDVLAIDIPIGLTDHGPRLCDLDARAALGRPRASSVFPPPIRPVLGARDYREACRIGRDTDGKALSIQAWGITAKIREVDAFLAADLSRQGWVREAHPELSFQRARGGRPMAHNKKTAEGRREREALIASLFGDVLPTVRMALGKGAFAPDDLLDALILAWTAERLRRGTGDTLPASPPLDSTGLRMEICV